MSREGASLVRKRRKPSAFWLKQLHSWHWISSAVCLVGMLLFTVTGITLNHAADIEGSPTVVAKEAVLPASLLRTIAPKGGEPEGSRPVPQAVRAWLGDELGVSIPQDGEWSAGEIALAMPQPGGDAWASVDRGSGAVAYEHTDRGWISYLNDLHKGRNAGNVWYWFIDVFAGGALVFSLTGLVLLWLHSAKRPSTWPLVAGGLLIPTIIAIAFIH